MSTRSVLTSLATLLSSRGQNGYLSRPLAARNTRDLTRTGRVCANSACQSRWLHSEPKAVSAKFGGDNAADDPRELAEDAFSKLAKKGRSWKRLRHLVDLACLCYEPQVRSIADVGCDHGLLSLGLALSGRFESVVGVDVSEQALNDGGIALYHQLLQDLKKDERWESLSLEQLKNVFQVDFRVGDGLRCLDPGQADVLCIAGMGVNTMAKILEPSEVDRVGCQFLVLQPTNSRPRNLIRLYENLAETGWTATNERIEYLSKRWYMSTLFARLSDASPIASGESSIPGQLLAVSDDSYAAYVRHHQQWIKRDSQNESSMDENDCRWLRFVDGNDANTTS